jgi:hypothetical protein
LEVSRERSFVLARIRSCAGCPDSFVVPARALLACRVRRRGSAWRARSFGVEQPACAPGRLASRLRGIGPLTFEVVEGPASGVDAERYAYSPELGLFRSSLAASGDLVVGEAQLRALLEETGTRAQLASGLRELLGSDWDDALEPLRVGGDGAPVTWLRQTG